MPDDPTDAHTVDRIEYLYEGWRRGLLTRAEIGRLLGDKEPSPEALSVPLIDHPLFPTLPRAESRSDSILGRFRGIPSQNLNQERNHHHGDSSAQRRFAERTRSRHAQRRPGSGNVGDAADGGFSADQRLPHFRLVLRRLRVSRRRGRSSVRRKSGKAREHPRPADQCCRTCKLASGEAVRPLEE